MEVRKEELQDLTWMSESENFKVVQEKFDGDSRWSLHYSQVLKHKKTEKFYRTSYSKGATECQDESPYEYEPDTITLKEVFPFKRTVTDYKEAA